MGPFKMAASMRISRFWKSPRSFDKLANILGNQSNSLCRNAQRITITATQGGCWNYGDLSRHASYRAFHSAVPVLAAETKHETIEGKIIEEAQADGQQEGQQEVQELHRVAGVKDGGDPNRGHNIIRDTETAVGDGETMEFQAETRKLLDIVAKSLYSEKEVFIRELISNCTDAINKLKFTQMSEPESVVETDTPLEIHIATNDSVKTLTMQDTGVGMTKEQLIDNLGVIARSGSKKFVDSLAEDLDPTNARQSIIGQFGVGFYSAFMVAERVDVYSKTHTPGAKGYKWSSDGLGTFEICEAERVQPGTKIVLNLKDECHNYCDTSVIKEVVHKYSNFVGHPIFLNGDRINLVAALWEKETRDITQQEHDDFYKYQTKLFDKPRYSLHYKTDAPLSIKALFYVPTTKPTQEDLAEEMKRGAPGAVCLYSRHVMIMKAGDQASILPKWLRFIRGVVDCEDIPLNLSRELLQDSILIKKISWVLTNRILKFFREQAKKDVVKYKHFIEDFKHYFREGVVSTTDQQTKEEIANLFRFETSKLPEGDVTSLSEYVSRQNDPEDGKNLQPIHYFFCTSRLLADNSPYMDAFKDKGHEVIYVYTHYDEVVLLQLGQFQGRTVKSIESEDVKEDNDRGKVDASGEGLRQSEAMELVDYMKIILGSKVKQTKITNKLSTHPCILKLAEAGAARHFVNTSLAGMSSDEQNRILNPELHINPKHTIIQKLHKLRDTDDELARLVVHQLFDNSMIEAGLLQDARSVASRVNELLEKTLIKF